MNHSLFELKEIVNQDLDIHGEIPARHTRHFDNIREEQTEQFWARLSDWAAENHSLDIDEIADRGSEYKTEHTLTV